MIIWSVPTISTGILTTGLDALPSADDATGYALSSIIDNTALRLLYGELDLKLASAIVAGTTGFVSPVMGIYLIPEVGAANSGIFASTNQNAQTAGPTSRNNYVGEFSVASGATFQHLVSPMFRIPARRFKILVHNLLLVSLPASGSTIDIRRFSEEASA